MKLQWHISRSEAAQVNALIRQQSANFLVKRRRLMNLANDKPPVRRSEFWRQMVSMRLTSIQRSGPTSHVAKFNAIRPFPLSYRAVRAANRPKTFIAQALQKAGGIRFIPTIARQLAQNFDFLEGGGWQPTLDQCNRLRRTTSPDQEREVAHYIDEKLKGFGPKQSRNLLQALGLTRYETPIDSRITEWLNDFGFPVKLTSAALSDRNYYEFIEQGIQALCAKADVYPCVLDAAIFAMKDGEGWTEKNVF
jgi:hypothetical protein